jgi:hypothetical protein
MIALANLPFTAREKFRAMEDSENEAQALVSATMRRLSELNKALITGPADEAANIEHEQSRMRARLAQHQESHQAPAAFNVNIRRWLDGLASNATLEAAKALKVKLKSGETHSQAVARLREQIGALRTERTRTELAAPTVEEMKAAAAEHVSKLAERGTPRLAIQHGKFELRFNPELDAGCLLAWFHAAALLKRLEAQIDAMPKPALAVTAKARADRLATIKAELLELERLEESLIVAAEEEGQSIPRRANADPYAILGLVVARNKADAA